MVLLLVKKQIKSFGNAMIGRKLNIWVLL